MFPCVKLKTVAFSVAHPPEKRAEAFKLYMQGSEIEEISGKLTIPYDTVAKWSSREKWKHRRADKYAGVTPSVRKAESEMSVVLRTAGATLDEKQAKFIEAGADEGLRLLEAVKETPKEQLLAQSEKISKAIATAQKLLRLEEAKPSTVIQIGFLQSPDKPGVTAIYPPTQQPLTIEAVTV